MILRLFAYCFMAFATLGMLWLLGWMWFAANVASMKPQEEHIKADAIVVLTGGDRRINEGLDLIAQGNAERLLISGVNPQVKPEELIALWDKDRLDVLPKVSLDHAAANTATNASESRAWIEKNDIGSIRLVTANYHMMRSYMMFHRAMPELVIYKHPVSPEDFEPWTKPFWHLTFSEYNKWLATWLRFDLLDKNPSLANQS